MNQRDRTDRLRDRRSPSSSILPVTLIAVSLGIHACNAVPSTDGDSPMDTPGLTEAVELLLLANDAVPDGLNSFGEAVGERTIVLLGENGHGVGEFSTTKVELVKYLHEHLGFNILAFESGFHECREANELLDQRPALQSLRNCLIVQLHHQELEPLFEYAVAVRDSHNPLTIAGTDFQAQSFSTRTRPGFLRNALRTHAPGIADEVAVADSTIIELSFQSQDSLRAWVRVHGRRAKVLYDSGAVVTAGDTSWAFEAGSEFMRRQLHRVAAESYDLNTPPIYYEIRDKWMARTIARLAEADSGRNKIVVWLHNDHARYGNWQSGSLRVRATGQFLRERYSDRVFSVGLFAVRGTYADNFRRERQWAEPPPGSLELAVRQAGFTVSFLRLSNPRNAQVSEWAQSKHPYVRAGSVRDMIPGLEFDAIIVLDSISSASY